MAATGFTPISLYYSSTTGTSPTAGNLVAGELALNTFDGKLFYKDSSGVVQVIATKGTGTIGGSNTQVQYNSSGAFAGSANFVWDNSNVRLGIGTASPEQKFHISVASGNVYQQISSGANNIYFGYVSADAAASIQSNGAITFLSGGSYLERMRITSGGIALIGTTSASGSNLLQVNSDASISGLTVGKGLADSQGTALGNAVLSANTTGFQNAGAGYQALKANTTGYINSGFGAFALTANTTGNANSAFGRYALLGNTTASNNSAFGSSALETNTTGASNTALGASALALNTTASNNTAVGYQAAYSNTTGYNLACVGYKALYANTTGVSNSAFGIQAFQSVTTGTDNTGVGTGAGAYTTTGNYNTAIGSNALVSNTTASNNTAVGYQAGYANTTGTQSTYIGDSAGLADVSIGRNTYIGRGSGNAMTSGAYNTILGRFSGNAGGLDIRTLSNYIVLSDGDGNPRAYWRDDGTVVTTASATDFYSLRALNSQATRPYGVNIRFSGTTPNNTTQSFLDCEDTTNTKCIIYSNGTISNRTGTYNTISDQKIKQDIVDAGSQWDDIKAIRFRKYRLIDDVNANPDAPYLMGVVAQELQQTSPNLIDECVDKEGKVTLGVKQSIIFMKATKALQEAMERIEALEIAVDSLKQQLGK